VVIGDPKHNTQNWCDVSSACSRVHHVQTVDACIPTGSWEWNVGINAGTSRRTKSLRSEIWLKDFAEFQEKLAVHAIRTTHAPWELRRWRS